GDPGVIGHAHNARAISSRSDNARDSRSVSIGRCAVGVASAAGRVIIGVEEIMRIEIGVIVIKAVVNDADLDTYSGVVLPSFDDVDSNGSVDQSPLPVGVVGIRRRCRISSWGR